MSVSPSSPPRFLFPAIWHWTRSLISFRVECSSSSLSYARVVFAHRFSRRSSAGSTRALFSVQMSIWNTIQCLLKGIRENISNVFSLQQTSSVSVSNDFARSNYFLVSWILPEPESFVRYLIQIRSNVECCSKIYALMYEEIRENGCTLNNVKEKVKILLFVD